MKTAIKTEIPGRYESNLAGYPGHIQFPNPLRLAHFKAWWETAITPLKTLTKLDFDHAMSEWKAAAKLILEFGEWEIKSVPRGEVAADQIPVEVVNFVLECADDYIYPLLPEKKRQLIRTATL